MMMMSHTIGPTRTVTSQSLTNTSFLSRCFLLVINIYFWEGNLLKFTAIYAIYLFSVHGVSLFAVGGRIFSRAEDQRAVML